MSLLLLQLACAQAGAPVPEDTANTTPTEDTATTDLAPDVGSLVISEVMFDPDAVDGDLGEYVELYNASGRDLDLEGLVLADGDGEGVTVSGALLVPAGQYVVLGASTNVDANGGFTAAYAWDAGTVKLSNEADRLTLSLEALQIDQFAYDVEAWNVDEGEAVGVDPSRLDAASNDVLESWCPQRSEFGQGDRGTPGRANDACD
jgi:hypothetical protein